MIRPGTGIVVEGTGIVVEGGGAVLLRDDYGNVANVRLSIDLAGNIDQLDVFTPVYGARVGRRVRRYLMRRRP